MLRFLRHRSASYVLALAVFSCSIVAFAVDKNKAASPATDSAPAVKMIPLLPADFAGWHSDGTLPASTRPEVADAANATVLREYGFTQFAQGNYVRGPNKLNVKAIQFGDASGAYGAYTFYRHSGWPREEVGSGGSSDNNRILFWVGDIVVDASFDHVSAMSGSELRDLAKALPLPSGNAGVLPSLPGYLPKDLLQGQSTHYALGPEGYVRSGGVLPAAIAGFDRGAETLTATYSTHDGDATLTLLNYPTPQLAMEREKAITGFLKAGNTPQSGWTEPLLESNPSALLVRRSGPIIAVTSGALPESAARKILSQINYQADVTWNNPQGYNSEASKTARLLLSIFALTGILGGAAIMLGVFLGGGRALYRKMRGRPISTLEEAEFISLNLRE